MVACSGWWVAGVGREAEVDGVAATGVHIKKRDWIHKFVLKNIYGGIQIKALSPGITTPLYNTACQAYRYSRKKLNISTSTIVWVRPVPSCLVLDGFTFRREIILGMVLNFCSLKVLISALFPRIFITHQRELTSYFEKLKKLITVFLNTILIGQFTITRRNTCKTSSLKDTHYKYAH